MKVIAHIRTDFTEKFGIPRQSGQVMQLKGKIVFEPEYRIASALKGLEGFSHIWVIWKFSKAEKENWSATVKPPRLGGKERRGVFATRSPFRPNPIGLSALRLEKIEYDEKLGPVLCVSGIDMLDGTPVYDIKPYLSYADSIPEAICGFADEVKDHSLRVDFPVQLSEGMTDEIRKAVIGILQQDPRSAYISDEDRIWGITYGNYNVKFRVSENLVTVVSVEQICL